MNGPMIPIRLIYLSADPAEAPNREFDIQVYAVPRIGEQIKPQAGSGGRIVVINVMHTLFTLTPDGGPVEQRIHVIAKEYPRVQGPPPD